MSLSADLSVRQGTFHLLAELAVAPGEVVGLLGPNGAGKTTLLRALAGALRPAAGRVELAGRVLTDTAADIHVPMADRRVAVMYQNYLLFDHLSVLENVAFGLRARRMGRSAARAAAMAWTERLGIGAVADRRPATLSGGQRQRVALARTLASDPDLLLLDEPLAALDATARGAIRRDLRDHLLATDRPSILVTHDPIDAMMLTDRLVVLEDGRVTQAGTFAQVGDHPRTAYVAGLLGLNLLTGIARNGTVELTNGGRLESADHEAIGPVVVRIAPTSVVVHLREPPEGSPRNVWPATVANVEADADRVRLHCAGNPPLLVEITPAALADLHLMPGSAVWLSVKASAVQLTSNAGHPWR